MFDLAIKNGYVIDPSGRIHSKLNIGVKDGKVAAVTVEDISGSTEIDAGGLIVSPGFIDMHIHEDLYNEETDSFQIVISETMLKMGVATVIGGNCGKGYTDNPVEYMNLVDRLGYPVNIGMLAPHERIRGAFGDFDNYAPIDKKYLSGMKELLRTWLEGGCLGLSLGIEYDPGIDEAEAVALMEIAAKNGKIVTAHQRSDGDKAIAAVEEYIAWGTSVGAKLHISHLSSMNSFGSMEETLSIIDSCRAKGLDIGFDGYPYYAFCTYLGSAVFDDGFLEKYNFGEEGYAMLQVASGPSAGIRLSKETFRELREKEPRALIIAHVLNEREVDLCIGHPACIVVSDGLYSNGQGHPRGAGTFPKLIRDYVIEKKRMTLNDAIEKITWMPAQRMGLAGKGSLKVGSDADITIFDLDTIKDEATYQESTKPPKGIEYVVINGQIALKGGEVVNKKLGRAIRK
ncbi:MAG TPA: amidohydrolase family protein [Anaerovoracaceae bacterium]|nr:amidohydrolase family protein [Anaerovoracaceae bacterium]